MSSHHTHGQLLKHYRMEENARTKRQEANAARRSAFEDTRRTAREVGKAVQAELTWWRYSVVGWQILWMATIATAVITTLKVLE